MGEYWESATKDLIREVGDPLLKVEFEPTTGKYEVLKLMTDYDSFDFSGAVFDSKADVCTLVFPVQHWSCQMVFDQWDGRVYREFEKAKWKNEHREEFKQKLRISDEKMQMAQEKKMDDPAHEGAVDLWNKLHPRVWSYDRRVS